MIGMTRPDEKAIRLGRQGRVVIPAAIRRQMELRPGVVLAARVEEGRLVLEPREAVLARARRRFDRVPSRVSLADELISDRREEARRESRS